jgi:hypothetical protein
MGSASAGSHITKKSVLIYGTKIVTLLKILIATIKTTISAGTTFKSFIVVFLVWPSLIDGKRAHEFSRLIHLRDVPWVTRGRGEPTLINAVHVITLLHRAVSSVFLLKKLNSLFPAWG